MQDILYDAHLPDTAQRAFIIAGLCERYPFLRRCTLGKSYAGRRMECLRLGGEKGQVLLAAAFHGMEWLTSLVLLRFTETLCRALQTGEPVLGYDLSALRQCGVCILPCVNPDGVDISLYGPAAAGPCAGLVERASGGDTASWQANAPGVDLNHNYDAGWEALHRMEREAGITGPGPTRFGGPCPESEIETQLVTALCRRVPFRRALAFHSQGEEIYWNFGPCTPACAYPLGRVFAMSSGYLLSAPEGLAVGGGFKDWFLSCFGRPAYTVEIGRGKNPLPLSDLSAVYSCLEEMLLLSVLL